MVSPPSTNKRLLRIVEGVMIIASLACVFIALMSWRNLFFARFAAPVTLLAFVVMIYAALLISGLYDEFRRSLGKYTATGDEGYGVSFEELRRQLRWSPKVFKYASLASILGLAATLIFLGPTSWSPGEPITQHKACVMTLSLFFLLVILLPEIASAARMPGSYDDHVGYLRDGETQGFS